MYVASLHVYPVKSCRGISLDQAKIGTRGFMYDRHWAVFDSAGKKVTQRENPRLALVQPSITNVSLTLDAPGQRELTIPLAKETHHLVVVDMWGSECRGSDEGRESAEWLSSFLKQHVSLIRYDDSHQRQLEQEWIGDTGATAAFADSLPFLFVSESSLRFLNELRVKQGLAPCPVDRFRPNVVLSNLEPFEEDEIAAIGCGDLKFDLVRPCGRCVVINIDQQSGEVEREGNLEILGRTRNLRNFLGRAGVMFGVLGIATRGVGLSLSVGSELVATDQTPGLPNPPRVF